MIEIATDVAFAVLALGMALSIVRLVRGPSLADRILALDVLTTLAIGVIGAFAMRSGQSLYIDLAVVLALVGFVATVAFARYLMSRSER